MPVFGPISRKDLVRYLRKMGFDGPYSGRNEGFQLQSSSFTQYDIRKTQYDLPLGFDVRAYGAFRLRFRSRLQNGFCNRNVTLSSNFDI